MKLPRFGFWFWMVVLDVAFAPVLFLIYGALFGFAIWWDDLRENYQNWIES